MNHMAVDAEDTWCERRNIQHRSLALLYETNNAVVVFYARNPIENQINLNDSNTTLLLLHYHLLVSTTRNILT